MDILFGVYLQAPNEVNVISQSCNERIVNIYRQSRNTIRCGGDKAANT